MNAASTYLLDNASDKAGTRMDVLARLFDADHAARARERRDRGRLALPGSGRRRRQRGALAGGTRRARGHVLCTDLDTRIIEQGRAAAGANLEVMRHDIAQDPLPAASFDLIHARLVLIHVIERERALESMVEALKPGGWLVIEDFDSASVRPDAHDQPVRDAAANLGGRAQIPHAQPGWLLRPPPVRAVPRTGPDRGGRRGTQRDVRPAAMAAPISCA